MTSGKWLVAFGGIALVILMLLNWGYRMALNSVRDDLDDRLGRRLPALVEDLAVQIDPASVTGEISVDDYVELYERLQNYQRAHDLADARLVDTAFVDLLAGPDDSLAVALVSRLDYPTFLAAVSGFTSVSPTDHWADGYYKAAYGPIFSSSGRCVGTRGDPR